LAKKNQIIITTIFFLLLPVFILLIRQQQDIRRHAADIPANIVIHTQNSIGNIPKSFWSNFSQGGEESHTNMIKPALIPLRMLSPEYIRIDHVFNYYTPKELDETVETIISTGAKPFFSLTNPDDVPNWEEAVTSLVKRYSVEKNIQNIYYEVLNEPDLYNKMHYKGDNNYLDFYAKTATAVAAGAQSTSYKIGGPSTSGYYSNWIKNLLEYCNNNHIRLDFLSWHKYSKYISDYQSDIDNLNSLLAYYPSYRDIEKIISEFGPTPENDDSYNSLSAGIHLLSSASRLSPFFHKVFTFEIVDGINSHWGLIKRDGSTKPRYTAFIFLNQLKGNLIGQEGNGSFVSALATKQNNIIQVLLVNYDPDNKHEETVPITLKDLPPGQYKLNKTQFLGNTTSEILNNNQTAIYMSPNSAYLLELTIQ
jgi:hypothetical protein